MVKPLRQISIPKLNPLPGLHLEPIDLVDYKVSSSTRRWRDIHS